jgi:hypothetical protein
LRRRDPVDGGREGGQGAVAGVASVDEGAAGVPEEAQQELGKQVGSADVVGAAAAA